MAKAPETVNEVEEMFGRTTEVIDDTEVVFDPDSECYLVIELGTHPTFWRAV